MCSKKALDPMATTGNRWLKSGWVVSSQMKKRSLELAEGRGRMGAAPLLLRGRYMPNYVTYFYMDRLPSPFKHRACAEARVAS